MSVKTETQQEETRSLAERVLTNWPQTAWAKALKKAVGEAEVIDTFRPVMEEGLFKLPARVDTEIIEFVNAHDESLGLGIFLARATLPESTIPENLKYTPNTTEAVFYQDSGEGATMKIEVDPEAPKNLITRAAAFALLPNDKVVPLQIVRIGKADIRIPNLSFSGQALEQQADQIILISDNPKITKDTNKETTLFLLVQDDDGNSKILLFPSASHQQSPIYPRVTGSLAASMDREKEDGRVASINLNPFI